MTSPQPDAPSGALTAADARRLKREAHGKAEARGSLCSVSSSPSTHLAQYHHRGTITGSLKIKGNLKSYLVHSPFPLSNAGSNSNQLVINELPCYPVLKEFLVMDIT